MTTKSKNPETLVLHAGPRSDSATDANAVPIYQTTSYQFHSIEHAANLFALKELAQGRDRFELLVGAAVLANNLTRIADLLAKQKQSSCRRKAA